MRSALSQNLSTYLDGLRFQKCGEELLIVLSALSGLLGGLSQAKLTCRCSDVNSGVVASVALLMAPCLQDRVYCMQTLKGLHCGLSQ